MPGYTADDIAVWCDGVRERLHKIQGYRSCYVVVRHMAFSTGDSGWQIGIDTKPSRLFEAAHLSDAITQAEAWLDTHEHADERLSAVLGIPLTQAAE